MNPKDLQGKELKVGQLVARAYIHGPSVPLIELRRVTRIENDLVYLDNSPRALNFPSRVLIFEDVET